MLETVSTSNVHQNAESDSRQPDQSILLRHRSLTSDLVISPNKFAALDSADGLEADKAICTSSWSSRNRKQFLMRKIP